MEAITILSWAGEALVQSGTVAGATRLWNLLRDRFRGNPAIEATLTEIEAEPTPERLQQVAPALQAEMSRDRAFVEALVQAVEELQQEIAATKSSDSIAIDARSYDSSTQKVVGKIEGDVISF